MPDTTPNTATVLVHATAPDRVEDAYDAIAALVSDDEIVSVTRVVTAYDLLVVVLFPSEGRLSAIVRQVQELDDVDRTLTLVHVPEEPSDA